MKVGECIQLVNSTMPNPYDNNTKARWVRECEGKVFRELYLLNPQGFSWGSPTDYLQEELSLPAPYNNIYALYMEAQIHYHNAEPDRYNMTMSLFNQSWHELCVLFGQDIDVSDFRRNPLVRSEIEAYSGTYLVMKIPEYCSLAGGQIVLQSPDFVGATLTMTVGTSQYRREISSVTPRTYYHIPMLTAPSGGDTLTIGLSYSSLNPVKSIGEVRSLEPDPSEWFDGMGRRVMFLGRLLVPDMVFQRWGYADVHALGLPQQEVVEEYE